MATADFGEPLDLEQFYAKGDRLRTHKEIADFLMRKIGELGELDKAKFGRASGVDAVETV